MWTADAVLVCALALLGRSADSLPRIEFVHHAPFGVSKNAEGYVHREPDAIVLITGSAVFQDAARAAYACGNALALAKIASVLVHEEAHLRENADEARAYARQRQTLLRLGIRPDSYTYRGVLRAERAVLRAVRAGD